MQALFGLDISHIVFLPINVDTDCAVFRVVTPNGVSYFLKLRRGVSNDLPLRVAAFLHGRGIHSVMAPIATAMGELTPADHGWSWMLYPFFHGRTAMQAGLSRTQWSALGECMRAIHSTGLPADLVRQIAREDLAPNWRRAVDTLPERLAEKSRDSVVRGIAEFWATHRASIEHIVSRAEQLAQALETRALDLVLCHSDLHANNVLVGASGEIAVIDWDQPILAPKERDLMFVGGGVGGIWNRADEAAWFYEGYRPRFIDPVILAYYRYERIVEDLAAYGERILNMKESVEDRAEGLRRMANAFLPGNVVEMADSSYQH